MREDAAVVSKDKQRKKAGGNSLSSRKELAFFQREATVLNQSILASKTAGASLDISFSPVEVYRKQGWAQGFSTALFYSLSVCPSACLWILQLSQVTRTASRQEVLRSGQQPPLGLERVSLQLTDPSLSAMQCKCNAPARTECQIPMRVESLGTLNNSAEEHPKQRRRERGLGVRDGGLCRGVNRVDTSSMFSLFLSAQI